MTDLEATIGIIALVAVLTYSGLSGWWTAAPLAIVALLAMLG